jgi:16S rRNA (adenine1518-N6/adenine1519-N6)-dimethyltransferase
MLTLKKTLGQHFLHDENICRKIVDIVRQQTIHQLLEIGPGAGALTKYFIEWEAVRFKAVELDDEKVGFLIRKYPVLRDKIIHRNFLDTELPFEGKFTIAGNFPYNISSQIVFKILEWKDHVEGVVGMFQKEMAQRIAAKEGNKTYGVISILVQAFFDVVYLFEVSENSFVPAPKVKGAVIRMSPRAEPLTFKSEQAYFRLVKTAFTQRRKTMRNAVRGLFDTETLKQEIFNKRPEQLSINDFAALTFSMK